METNIEEIWKDIAGLEGKYQISNLGRVKSLERYIINNRWGRNDYRIVKERILKPGIAGGGYLHVVLNKTRKIHRLVADEFIPNPQNKREVNHINGDKTDNRACNLEWATPRENSYHHVLNNREGKKSKFLCLTYRPKNTINHWEVRVRLNGERHFLGSYKTEEIANEVLQKFLEEKGLSNKYSDHEK